MKAPRFASPAAIPEQAQLPAVAAVLCQGFLSESAPIACFGPAKDPVVYLLLSHSQRRAVAYCVPNIDVIMDRLAPVWERYAVLRPDGTRGVWHNAENLWVAASWLSALPWQEETTHKAALVRKLVNAALE